MDEGCLAGGGLVAEEWEESCWRRRVGWRREVGWRGRVGWEDGWWRRRRDLAGEGWREEEVRRRWWEDETRRKHELKGLTPRCIPLPRRRPITMVGVAGPISIAVPHSTPLGLGSGSSCIV